MDPLNTTIPAPIRRAEAAAPQVPAPAPAPAPTAPPAPAALPADRVTLSRDAGSSPGRGNFLSGAFAEAWAPAPAANRPDPHFQYDAKPVNDYRGSQKWRPGSQLPSGAVVNDKITKDYDHLNGQMQRYFAGDPKGEKLPVVNDFAGLAKYGSRLAGEQIRNLEDLQKGAAGDPRGFTTAARNMANGETMEQGGKMGLATTGRNLAAQNPLLAALAPGLAGTNTAAGTTKDTLRTMGKMRDMLVEGNTTIHDSAGRAYDAFLKGESSGKGGMEALKEAGYFPGSKDDPMGMYTQAFGGYKQARELGLQAQQEKDPVKKQEMLAQREQLMKDANLKLFIHEQKSLEKPSMYGDTDMKNAVRSIGGSMILEDPHGKYPLLPKGGDWTDFNTRMGFEEVKAGTPGAITVPNPDGTATHYKVDPNAKGTVSDYSNSRTAGPLAPALSSNSPAPLFAAPTSSTGRGMDRLGNATRTGNLTATGVEAAALPVRVTSDGLSRGGAAVSQNGQNNANVAKAVYAANAVNRPGLTDDAMRVLSKTAEKASDAQATAGFGMQVTGHVLDRAAEKGARTLNATANTGKTAWNATVGARFGIVLK